MRGPTNIIGETIKCKFSRFFLAVLPLIGICQLGLGFVVPHGCVLSTKWPHSQLTYVGDDFKVHLLLASSNGQSSSERRTRMSRPERKRLERERKQQRLQKKTRKPPRPIPVSQLSEKSSAEEVRRIIKDAQNYQSHRLLETLSRFLIDDCSVDFAGGSRGSLLSRLAVAALHLGNHEVARQALDLRRQEHGQTIIPMESAAIVRRLVQKNNDTEALEVLRTELSLPNQEMLSDEPELQDRLKYRALALSYIACGYFREREPYEAVSVCKSLADMGPLVRKANLIRDDLEMPWLKIIQSASQCEAARRGAASRPAENESDPLPGNLVYSVLSAMATFPSENDNEVFEAVSNALVRRIIFVTGAVSMSKCPPADRGEAVFIGRSNVGKSSLINMLVNRNSLAFTSKRPGKTQQFNYFAVNDKAERERELKYRDTVPGKRDRDSFYIVDLPGFGYASVPTKQRQEWSQFMADYLSNRRTLKVIFHLIDSRHGPSNEDVGIMKQIRENLPKSVRYVVVLTKADKNVSSASTLQPGKVSPDVMEGLRQTMVANRVGNAPVILTSSETKLGRDDLWRYLRFAAES